MTTDRELAEAALEAARCAYAPYSHFLVGAALLTETGELFTGCNVENASYGAANCAERTAFFKAVSSGHRRFAAIAIAGGAENEPIQNFAYPCGICRQVMKEFCGPEFRILVVKTPEEIRSFTLEQLLPFGFGGEII